MPKFRILHTESSHGLGGQEYRIISEAKGMSLRGHYVLIAAPKDSQLIKLAHQEGIQYQEVSVGIWGWGRLVPTFLKMIVDHQIEIIHTHGSQDSWTASIAGRLSSLKPIIIRSRHKSTPISQTCRHRWLYKYLPHGVMTTSQHIQKEIIARLGLDPNRTYSVPTGVDLNVFDAAKTDDSVRKEFGISKEVTLLGTVAFLRDYKGIHLCLDAVKVLRHKFPTLTFLVVGEGPEETRLREKAKVLGIQKHVYFSGFRTDIHRVLASLDIFVLPSTEGEGVPQAITQAMAMGVPVVGASTGGIPEVVEQNLTGLLVSANDVGALTHNLVRLIEDKQLRTRLGQNGREFIAKFYTMETMIEKVERMYASLWKEERGKRRYESDTSCHLD